MLNAGACTFRAGERVKQLSFQLISFVCHFRSTEASSHLSAILTAYDLLAMFVVRKLGLSLGELDNVVSGTKSVEQVKASVTAFGNAPADKQL